MLVAQRAKSANYLKTKTLGQPSDKILSQVEAVSLAGSSSASAASKSKVLVNSPSDGGFEVSSNQRKRTVEDEIAVLEKNCEH